jgi:hypothetical protein
MDDGFQLNEYVETETNLQAAAAEAFDRLLRPPAMWTAFNAGHIKLTSQQAAKLKRIGLKPNWPDHLILWDRNLIGIEWKKPGEGKLSRGRFVTRKNGSRYWVEGQREVFPQLTAAGMMGPYECTSIDHCFRILKAIGVPMLWREQ